MWKTQRSCLQRVTLTDLLNVEHSHSQGGNASQSSLDDAATADPTMLVAWQLKLDALGDAADDDDAASDGASSSEHTQQADLSDVDIDVS